MPRRADAQPELQACGQRSEGWLQLPALLFSVRWRATMAKSCIRTSSTACSSTPRQRRYSQCSPMAERAAPSQRDCLHCAAPRRGQSHFLYRVSLLYAQYIVEQSGLYEHVAPSGKLAVCWQRKSVHRPKRGVALLFEYSKLQKQRIVIERGWGLKRVQRRSLGTVGRH